MFEFSLKGNVLTITTTLNANAPLSKSEKSNVHASTNGNVVTGIKVGGKDLIIGLNAYTKV